MQRCIKGDREAQYFLFEQTVGTLYHSVIRLVPRKEDAEEIVQDAYVSIFKNIKSYRADSNLESWMRKIAINKAIDHIRKNRIKWYVELDDYPAEEEPQFEHDLEKITELHNEIKKLPNGCREVLSLFAFENWKHAKIADHLGISESTSRTQYHRAKALLKKALSKSEINE